MHCDSRCEYRANDQRRRPVSHAYVTALETRVAWHESLLKKLKSANSTEREALLTRVNVDDHFGLQDSSVLTNDDFEVRTGTPSSPLPADSLNRGSSGESYRVDASLAFRNIG